MSPSIPDRPWGLLFRFYAVVPPDSGRLEFIGARRRRGLVKPHHSLPTRGKGGGGGQGGSDDVTLFYSPPESDLIRLELFRPSSDFTGLY